MKVTKVIVFNVQKDVSEYDFSVQYYTDHGFSAVIVDGVRLSPENYERRLGLDEFEVSDGVSTFQEAISPYLCQNA